MNNKSKKRIFASLVCALLCFVAPLGFSSCGEGDGELAGITITQTVVAPSYDISTVPIYKEFANVAKPAYLVPGLKEGLIPQGMDVWEEKELLFISGYFKPNINTSGSPSSMLVAVDLKTGKLAGKYCIKKEDGTYYTGHNGGIAITEKNIFIASGGLGRIPLSQIETLGEEGTLQIVESIKIPVGTSWLNYSDGVLWVGDFYAAGTYPTPQWRHMTNDDGTTYGGGGVGYKVKDTESEFSSENWDPKTMSVARPDYYLAIPDSVQGFTFIGDQIVLSSVQGDEGSNILVYDNVLKNEIDAKTDLNGTNTANPVPVWFLDDGVLVKDYTAIPMSEGVTSYKGKLLVLFESGAAYYQDFIPQISTDHVWSVALPEKEGGADT